MSDKKDITFESAEAGDTEGLVMAIQRGICGAMRKLVKQLEIDVAPEPGLKWEQIYFLIDQFEKKKALIVEQKDPI